jgi:outer membrane protein insertion porin family
LQAQIGYSDQSGLIAAVSISKGNLGGRGQTLRFSTEFAERFVRQSFLVDFIEPHLFDTNYSSETTLGYVQRDDITELQRGIITELTASQGLGYLLLPRLRLGFTYEATNRGFANQNFSPLQLRTLTNSLTWRTVNSPTFPTDGSIVSLAASQVGGEVLQGNTEYRRYNFSAQRFVAMNQSSTLVAMGRVRLGWLEQVGDNLIPIEDRFRIGGLPTLRGYNSFEVGGPYGVLERSLNALPTLAIDSAGEPVTDANGLPTTSSIDKRTIGLTETQLARLQSGGVQQRVFNLELLFPLAGDNIRGVVFYDAGQVNAEPFQYQLLKEHEPAFFDLLQSYGFGIRMITPMGVFRFEYGVKLNTRPGESPDKFDFTISTLF